MLGIFLGAIRSCDQPGTAICDEKDEREKESKQ